MERFRHWLVMAILCFAGGIIFMLPFLREVYYIPMQEAFGYSNTQMGVLMSVFGAVSRLTYCPGGWPPCPRSLRRSKPGLSGSRPPVRFAVRSTRRSQTRRVVPE